MLRTLRLAVFGAAVAAAMLPAPTRAQSNVHYVLGKPYQFDGVWYQPAVDYGYDQTGTASIYAPGRAGLSTTSGEPYDENAITGAHKTLPLPCMVRITNLENGKSITLRLNDRGPFVDDRIVELTPAAARALGVTTQTSLQVRVQIMAKESQALADALQPAGGAPAPTPVVKVTSLPLASGTPMQPLKPVAAPGAEPALPPQPTSPPANTPPTVPAASAAAASTPAPQPTPASTIPLAIPLPEPAPAPPPAKPSPPPASASVAPTPPAPASSPAPAEAAVHIVVPSDAPAPALSVAPAPAPAPIVTPNPAPVPVAATPVTPTGAPAQTLPEVSVNVSNSTVPPPSAALVAPQPAIPVQLSSAPAPTGTGKIKPLPVDLPAQFFIQTGAFKKTADADTLRDKLTVLAPAKVVPTRLGADEFNAVLLGPIPTMNDAQRLLKQITGMGYSDAVLIIE